MPPLTYFVPGFSLIFSSNVLTIKSAAIFAGGYFGNSPVLIFLSIIVTESPDTSMTGTCTVSFGAAQLRYANIEVAISSVFIFLSAKIVLYKIYLKDCRLEQKLSFPARAVVFVKLL